MTHSEFNHLLGSIAALSPDQMRRLRDELDGKLAASANAGPPDLQQPPVGQETSAQARKPVWERILERTAAIPDEEWDKLPADLAEQHDHYLYGTPKRPTA